MTDLPVLPQRDRIVLVTLQDGQQLEGVLLVRTGCYEIAGTLFAAWAIEELERRNVRTVSFGSCVVLLLHPWVLESVTCYVLLASFLGLGPFDDSNRRGTRVRGSRAWGTGRVG